jgi:osmotically inducible lipoprotein OsmB
MLKRTSLFIAAAAFALSAGAANADRCSGHGHSTGTAVGAIGGGLIGNAITHGSAVGVIGGAVAGGLAGNAIARDSNCSHRTYDSNHREYYYDRQHQRRYYD